MEETPQKLNLSFDRKRLVSRVFRFCIVAEISIVLMDICFNYLKWIPSRSLRKVFNITREDGLANWFASTQSVVVGIVLFMMFLLSRHEKKSSGGWALLSGFFLFMGLDDATKFHERLGSASTDVIRGIASVDTLPTYTWQFVFGPFLFCMGVYICWFLWNNVQDRRVQIQGFLALSCFVFAVGLDFVEGTNYSLNQFYWFRHNMKVLEEFIEMLGNTLFLSTFLTLFLERLQALHIEFKSSN